MKKWIEITKASVAGYRARNEPCTYVLPAESAKCFKCGKKIPNGQEAIHDMESSGFVKVFCSDKHFYDTPQEAENVLK